MIPFFLIALVVTIIDPYHYFFSRHFIPDTVKLQVINRNEKSMPRGNTLWKAIAYSRNPSPNVIIGDSRAFDLNPDTIQKLSHLPCFNFGVPGGNIRSVIETFWYVSRIMKPERLYIQVGYHTYSENNRYNLMSDALKVRKRPYLFYSRLYFLEESFLDLFHWITKKAAVHREIKFDPATWNKILAEQGENSLQSMDYPEDYYRELQEISAYCRENRIELNFILFPDHQDFHELIRRYSLQESYDKFKQDMHSLGRVYDFDTPGSSISSDRSNYRDIFHLQHELIDGYITRSIWKEK